ncbi:SusC/RagA family TonB-linked outer membrane protein [Pedobacter psychroterrae]|uniref:SusC/RagA family TonB-linked outer membrane protein n=1 Tax=Pedobacter psychroterrae TaxID=2530453 RepID=A0A4R0NQG8_9SPHI|nr:SusC/RagA family TonB-linked outer membrane protein [Pedobacter psychroterrae]TCD01324.1 SusC/RagA family TonB-linked outer membrane protein [Pedobacter psychroterrae]
MRIIATITFLGLLCSTTVSFGNTARSACISNKFLLTGTFQQTDTASNDTTAIDSANLGKLDALKTQNAVFKKLQSKSNNIDPKKLALFPAVSLQQFLKSDAAGVYVQEQSGEPGSVQSYFIHGTSQPLISAREQFQTQPLVILDGVPLTGDHPFALDIQQFKFERIGPATNPLSMINMDNILSVEVLKDLAATAIYGPKAVNGAIVLTSKQAGVKREIFFDSYVGMAQKNSVTTINGKFENDFRRQFYDKYTANGKYSENDVYPLYLSDSLNNAYYGPSNWNDEYYRNGLDYSVNAGISGGTNRANFRFSLGSLRNEGIADDTGLDRYSTRFTINMKPLTWLTFTATVNANRLDRQRNRNVRDRLAQVNYIPDLSSPIAPSKEKYGQYLAEFDKGFDDNRSNLVQGLANVGVDLGKFKFNSSFGVDYNEGYRDIFFARTLLQTTNYASNYYGYNQRSFFDNVATYDLEVNEDSRFNFTLGSSFQYDAYKYNYAYAYKGSNDFIKLNLLRSDPGNQATYLEPFVFNRFLVYKFLDKTRNNLISFNAKVDYDFKDKYTISAHLRADGASSQQPTSRWFYSPILSAGWNLKKEFFTESATISDLNLRASAGRMGRHEHFDNYAQGPQYTAFIGFTGNLIAPGYNGFATLTRPYSSGSIGYNLEWAYSDQLNLGLDGAFFNNRVRGSVDVYYKGDKNQLLGIPSGSEYGYSNIIQNGMDIVNTGVDLVLSADILQSTSSVRWTSTINANFNRNELTALPGGLSEIAIGDRLLKVGSSVDSYFLLSNNGIYNSDAEVPTVGGKKLSYNGIDLKGGDPKWADINGDNIIDNKDKTLQGHSMPIVAGGFNNDFGIGNWNIGVNFYYNLGRDLMNQEMANRFDFINREGLNDMSSVREITFWEKRGDYSKYPLYNPWSSVAPYQVNQDIFLEDASFLKLRTLSLGYDFTKSIKKTVKNMERFYVYTSVNNVFTLTKYTGQDPELVNYTGYDTGYGIPMPRTYILGVKMEF